MKFTVFSGNRRLIFVSRRAWEWSLIRAIWLPSATTRPISLKLNLMLYILVVLPFIFTKVFHISFLQVYWPKLHFSSQFLPLPAHLILLDLITLSNVPWWLQTMMLLTMQVSPPSCYFLLYRHRRDFLRSLALHTRYLIKIMFVRLSSYLNKTL